MRKLVLCFLVFCFAEIAVADVFINEIMYNPAGNDNNLEYVEIYSDSFVNLSSWIIEDSYSDDVLEALQYVDNGYSLIVEEGFDHTGLNASVYSAGATIGNNLNNDFDLVILRNNNSEIIDAVSYSSSWGGDNDGTSLCRLPNWQECTATAGKENFVAGAGCDWMLLVVINSTVLEDPEWQIRALKMEGDGKANLTIRHWIEDYDGNIVKEYSNLNFKDVLSQKTSGKYSPALNKGQGYFIKAEILNISCNDDNKGNVSELIFIPDEEGVYSLDSSITINDISPSNAEFGDVIKIDVNIYRGDTSKYAVYAYVKDDEKVSQKSTVHIRTKFVNHSMTIPVQLKSNCKRRYDDGEYDVIVEGFDIEDRDEVDIEGISSSLCSERKDCPECDECEEVECEVVVEDEEIEEENFFEESKSKLISWKEAIVYESTSFKAKKLVPSLFIVSLSLFVIILTFFKI
jgi:hypothetical protein